MSDPCSDDTSDRSKSTLPGQIYHIGQSTGLINVQSQIYKAKVGRLVLAKVRN